MLKRELKINLKGLVIWTGIMVAFFGVVFFMYPSIMNSENHQQINELMELFPPEMLKMFNMDLVGIDTVFGWIQTEGYMFLTLLGGIYAAILGATILVKEENDKTIEFLYAKPISRNRIVTTKIIAGAINLLLFTIIIATFNLIGLKWSNELEVKPFLWLSFSPLLLYFMLFFITLFLSTFMRKTKNSMSIGIGIVFISFLMQIIGNMGESAEIIKKISLFEFVSIREIITQGAMNQNYLIIGFLIIGVCVLGTYKHYNEKELV